MKRITDDNLLKAVLGDAHWSKIGTSNRIKVTLDGVEKAHSKRYAVETESYLRNHPNPKELFNGKGCATIYWDKAQQCWVWE